MKKQNTDKKILNKIEFSFENEQYIAQTKDIYTPK